MRERSGRVPQSVGDRVSGTRTRWQKLNSRLRSDPSEPALADPVLELLLLRLLARLPHVALRRERVAPHVRTVHGSLGRLRRGERGAGRHL